MLVLLIPALLGACVEFLRAAAARAGWTITRPELVLGTLLFALGGNLCWVEALRGQTEWLNPSRVHVACDGLGGLHVAPAFLGGWTWLLAVLALLLRWPGNETGRRPSSYPAVPLGLSVGALALIAEHSFLAVGMVLAIVTVCRWGRSWREAWPWLLADALGLALACVQGGQFRVLLLGKGFDLL